VKDSAKLLDLAGQACTCCTDRASVPQPFEKNDPWRLVCCYCCHCSSCNYVCNWETGRNLDNRTLPVKRYTIDTVWSAVHSVPTGGSAGCGAVFPGARGSDQRVEAVEAQSMLIVYSCVYVLFHVRYFSCRTAETSLLTTMRRRHKTFDFGCQLFMALSLEALHRRLDDTTIWREAPLFML